MTVHVYEMNWGNFQNFITNMLRMVVIFVV